jgi:hypothetical protein
MALLWRLLAGAAVAGISVSRGRHMAENGAGGQRARYVLAGVGAVAVVGLALVWLVLQPPLPICKYISNAASQVGAAGQATDTAAPTPAPIGMDANAQADPATREFLRQDVVVFYQYVQCLYRGDEFLGIAFTAAGIVATVAVTIAGAMKRATMALVFGAVATAIVGLQAAFPSGERATFYRGVLARTDGVLSQVTYVARTNAELNAVREALQQVKLDTALGLPRGRTSSEEDHPSSPVPAAGGPSA